MNFLQRILCVKENAGMNKNRFAGGACRKEVREFRDRGCCPCYAPLSVRASRVNWAIFGKHDYSFDSIRDGQKQFKRKKDSNERHWSVPKSSFFIFFFKKIHSLPSVSFSVQFLFLSNNPFPLSFPFFLLSFLLSLHFLLPFFFIIPRIFLSLSV